MAEDNDWNPGVWKGYSFDDARKSYDSVRSRSYADAVVNHVDAKDTLPDRLKTESLSPVIIACDVTGSMGTWPQEIFAKLPVLDLEGKCYLGADMEIAFMAVGDSYSDKYPLQVQEFCKGQGLVDALKGLIIEGGGGGTSHESYEMAAIYATHNVDMPNAVKPIMIFICDEQPYETVSTSQVKNDAKVGGVQTLTRKEIFDALKQKYEVFSIWKWYSEETREVWKELLGADHVAELSDPKRVIDVMFGLFAEALDKRDYFDKEIVDRQNPDQVDVVMKALKTIRLAEPKTPKMLGKNSTLRKTSTGKASSRLI